MSTENTKRKEFTVSHKNDLYPVDQSLANFARKFMRAGAPYTKPSEGGRILKKEVSQGAVSTTKKK